MPNLSMFRRGMPVVHVDKEAYPWKGRVTSIDGGSSGFIHVEWFNPKLEQYHGGAHMPEDLRSDLSSHTKSVAIGINVHWRELHDAKYQTTKEDSDRAFDHRAAVIRTAIAIADSLNLGGLERETFIEACSKRD